MADATLTNTRITPAPGAAESTGLPRDPAASYLDDRRTSGTGSISDQIAAVERNQRIIAATKDMIDANLKVVALLDPRSGFRTFANETRNAENLADALVVGLRSCERILKEGEAAPKDLDLALQKLDRMITDRVPRQQLVEQLTAVSDQFAATVPLMQGIIEKNR